MKFCRIRYFKLKGLVMKKIISAFLLLSLLLISYLIDRSARLSSEVESEIDTINIAGSGTGTCITKGPF